MSKLFNDQVIVCNCGGTMDIDGKKLAKICGSTAPCDVYTSLCRNQTDKLADAMMTVRDNDRQLISPAPKKQRHLTPLPKSIAAPHQQPSIFVNWPAGLKILRAPCRKWRH